MNNFEKGISSIGQLFPSPYSEYPESHSEWVGVADSFRQAGDSLRFSLEEWLHPKQENNKEV
jgi:hypothetical protein